MQLSCKPMIIINAKAIATEKSINTYLNLVHEPDNDNHFVFLNLWMFYHHLNKHEYCYLYSQVLGGRLTLIIYP